MKHLEKLRSLQNAIQATALPFEFGTDDDGGTELTTQLQEMSKVFEVFGQDGLVDLADRKDPSSG